ncbi:MULTISPECIES: MFS transporter [Streptomyces]|uniref:MFS transporter n=1 Tax=Streptomyces TaxID=1883 RepID=UPI001F20CCED|nr:MULTISPECIES: MFS transporter [unclassified Streptomyces]MCU4746192.1 MFS transporter [Streptomyces sp. G-5]
MARGSGRADTWLIVLGQSSQALGMGGIALFLPLIREDLGLSFAQAGQLAAVATLVYALMQVPAGWLTDRYSPKLLFCVGVMGTNATALAFAVLHPYGWLLAVQAVSGLFRSLIFAPGMMLIREQFPADRKATAMGLYVAGGFASSVLLNTLGPLVVGPLGWRWLFVIFGATGVLWAVLYHRVGTDPHREPGSFPRLTEIRRLFGHPALWLIGVIQFARLATAQGLAFWLPSYLVAEHGMSLSGAGAIAAVSALITAPSNLLGGWLSDRLGRPLLVITIALTALCASLAVLPLVDGVVPLLLVIGVNALFVQLYFGPLFGVGLHYLGQRTAGFSSGFGNFCANAGGFAAISALGTIKDSTGSFTLGFQLLAGLYAAALLAVLALTRTTPLTGRPAAERVPTAPSTPAQRDPEPGR